MELAALNTVRVEESTEQMKTRLEVKLVLVLVTRVNPRRLSEKISLYQHVQFDVERLGLSAPCILIVCNGSQFGVDPNTLKMDLDAP